MQEKKTNTYSFVSEQSGKRLDQLLVDYFEDIDDSFSRTSIQKFIKDGCVLVNKKKCKAALKLKTDDLVEIALPKKQEISVVEEDIKLRVVYEDPYLIVINKENNMVVHPAPGNYSGTLINAVLYHTKGKISDIGAPLRPGVVHRIDKQTSGLIVVAKDNYSHLDLAKQFASKIAFRKYTAVVWGNPENILKTDSIKTYFGRHPNDRKKFTSKVTMGKEALTYFKILKTNQIMSLLDVEIKTGRTHQIRVHFFDSHCPIVGDPVYSCKFNDKVKIKRQALHARYLSFIHPRFGIRLCFFSKIEDDIKDLIGNF